MRWPNAAHPFTSPIQIVRGGAQRLLFECEGLAFGQGRRPSEVAESSGLGHLGWAAAVGSNFIMMGVPMLLEGVGLEKMRSP
jgi:hypothetical protein